MRKLIGALVTFVTVIVIAVGAIVLLSRESATVAIEEGYGPDPKLPEPNPKLLPTVNIADAVSWPQA